MAQMDVEFEDCKFKLIKTKPDVAAKGFVKVDEKLFPALERYSKESGIEIDELASHMINFAICHLVIEEYDPERQKKKTQKRS